MEIIFASMSVDNLSDELFGTETGMPWPKSKEDMKHFVNVTKGKNLLMGRKTWETMPGKIIKNNNRTINVLSRSGLQCYAKDGEEADRILYSLSELKNSELNDIILIGGWELINSITKSKLLKKITKVHWTLFFADRDIEKYIKQTTVWANGKQLMNLLHVEGYSLHYTPRSKIDNNGISFTFITATKNDL